MSSRASDPLADGPLLRIELPEEQSPDHMSRSESFGIDLPTDLARRVDGTYEEALSRALGSLGEVTGSGVELVSGGEFRLQFQILLTVNDLATTLPIIRRTLRSLDAPEETVIRQYFPEELVFGLS